MGECEQYAVFMSKLPRPAAEALYWTFFVIVLCLLFSTSWRYGRVMERIEHMPVEDPARHNLVYRCFYFALFWGVASLVIAVLEAFVLLALQFCDQEPLTSLYWSTWTVLQVGAVVAIFGISLHVRHMIKGRRHPPWALALGTPVLVVAGLGHYFQGKIKRKAQKIARSKSRSCSRSPRGRSHEEPLSEVPTVRDESTDSRGRRPSDTEEDTPTVCGDPTSEKFNARIVGYTDDGDVILRISPEISQELTRKLATRQSSVAWEDEKLLQPPSAQDGAINKPWRHRSTSSVTYKGKEREELVAGSGCALYMSGDDSEKNNSLNTDGFAPPGEEKDFAEEERDLGDRGYRRPS